MVKGLNSDIVYKGSIYHIQTEDWGYENPYLVTQVFRSGAVIKVFKIPYTKVLPRGAQSEPKAIRTALEVQHHSILDLLVSGQLTSL